MNDSHTEWISSRGPANSVRVVQKTRTVLSSALTFAWRQQIIVINPARRVVLPTYRRAEIAPWSLAQLQRFLAAAHSDPTFAALLLLSVYGLRKGEALGLRWEDVDFTDGVLRIRQQVQRFDGEIRPTQLKTGASRRDLPLLAPVADALANLHHRLDAAPSKGDLVFVTRFGNPIEAGNLTRTFDRLIRTAGLPRIKMHHLRHTAATLLKDLGVPARDVQTILGHASIVTTQQLYQHADLTSQINALAKLERSLRVPQTISRQDVPSTNVGSPDGGQVFSGGSSQTRTGDTRLFRRRQASEPHTLTEVKLLGRACYLTAILGVAAVMFCRQDDGSRCH